MKPATILAALAISFSIMTPPALSQHPPPVEVAPNSGGYEELRVGITGILCYREPCPWNGVVRDTRPVLPNAVIWSGTIPPSLIGSPADIERVRDNYDDGCVIVEGRMVGGTLEIARIIGDCWRQNTSPMRSAQ